MDCKCCGQWDGHLKPWLPTICNLSNMSRESTPLCYLQTPSLVLFSGCLTLLDSACPACFLLQTGLLTVSQPLLLSRDTFSPSRKKLLCLNLLREIAYETRCLFLQQLNNYIYHWPWSLSSQHAVCLVRKKTFSPPKLKHTSDGKLNLWLLCRGVGKSRLVIIIHN